MKTSTNVDSRDEYLVRMVDITKRFPGVVANNQITFEVKKGEVHALLGENGAGKTTLMNVLYGLYEPEEGSIYVNGRNVRIRSPREAMDYRISMIHQHFMLVPDFDVVDNILLEGSSRFRVERASVMRRIEEFSEKYKLKIDADVKVDHLSAGERQKVEIVRAMIRDFDLLILDEPTSILTPQETEQLFNFMRQMASEGKGIVFITHKLKEVMSVADRISVLNKGKKTATLEHSSLSSVSELANLMVGGTKFAPYVRAESENRGESSIPSGQHSSPMLEVRGAWAMNDGGGFALRGVDLDILMGEIVGVAGVAGSGQRELSECITGLRRMTRGSVRLCGEEATNLHPRGILELGVAHVPEDRLSTGVIPDFSIVENFILGNELGDALKEIDYDKLKDFVASKVEEYDIRCHDLSVPVSTLSGGNLQKLILARELSKNPKVLISVQPTRGLDIVSTAFIRTKLRECRDRGTAILLISEDLDEILELSDRIAVMYEGKIARVIQTGGSTVNDLGLLMGGAS